MTGRGSRLREEIEIIPMGWVIASLIAFLAVQVLFWVVVPHFAGPHDLPSEPWWTLLRMSGSLLVLASVLLTGYIYGDAKRRGMNALLWTLLALLLPKPIGFIAYFLLRRPLPSPCPKCQSPVAADFAYCGKCGFVLAPVCANCGRALRRDFACCPYCGKTVGAAALQT